MIGDLHFHTKLSDGSLGLEDAVYFAKRAGLDFVAITDHDTMAGVTRAGVLGKRYGIHVIPGVEFSCYDQQRKRKVHLLCYLPQKPDRLEGVCSKVLDSRTKAGLSAIQQVSRFYPITAEFVARYYAGSKAIYKQHIMHALMDLGYTDRIFGDVFHQLFGRDGLVDMHTEYPDVYAVLDLIDLAGGFAVLAHPSAYQSMELAEELLEKGRLDGLEIYHPQNTVEDCNTLLQLAVKYDKMVFGGTDFHGFYTDGPNPPATCITPHDTLDRLFDVKKKLA